METLKYGLEIELPTQKNDGTPWIATPYIHSLQKIWHEKGYNFSLKEKNSIPQAIYYTKDKATIHASFDCVYSNIELAIGPYSSLEELHKNVKSTYNDTLDAVEEHDAYILNFAEAPNQSISKERYKDFVLDKLLYKYFTEHRKMKHHIGSDAKAQISPSTEIAPKDAILALNTVLKLSPIFFALYANSPFEEGKYTGFAENRAHMWKNEFQETIFKVDRLSLSLPPTFFSSWHHYIKWIYNRNVPTLPFAIKGENLKNAPDLYTIPSNPDLISYLKQEKWEAYSIINNKKIILSSSLDELILQQMTTFFDARLRYVFTDELPKKADFLNAYEKGGKYFDDYYTSYLSSCYIENRAPGSQCPDEELKNTKPDVCENIHISVCAFQAGILRNADEINAYLEKSEYLKKYTLFRELAIKDSIKAKDAQIALHTLSYDIVNLAKKALNSQEKIMLNYIYYVLEEKKSAADRALELAKKYSKDNNVDWKEFCLARKALKY